MGSFFHISHGVRLNIFNRRWVNNAYLSLWHIFRNFLTGYYTYEEAERVGDKNKTNASFHCMRTMVYYYLALRFRKSSKLLSCNFAIQYRTCLDLLEKKFAINNNNMNIEKILDDSRNF